MAPSTNAWGNRWDAATLRAAVRRHAGPVYAVCIRLLRDEDAAAESARACFIALAASGVPPHTGAWLHAEAVRTCLSRRPHFTSHELDAHGDIRLDEALAALAEPDRDLLIARYFEGASAAELAQRFGMARHLVRPRVDAALDTVSKQLALLGTPARRGEVEAALESLGATALIVPVTLTRSIEALAANQGPARPAVQAAANERARGRPVLFVALGLVLAAAAAIWPWPAGNAPDTAPGITLERTAAQKPPPASPEPAPATAPAATPVSAPAGGRIAGQVRMLDGGQPVPGAAIELRDRNGVAASTATEEDGRYVFEALAPAAYALAATYPGHGLADPVRVHLGENDQRDDVDLLLAPLATVRGHVFDRTPVLHPENIPLVSGNLRNPERQAQENIMRMLMSETNEPAPGIPVWLCELREGEARDWPAVAETVSDSRGAFEFSGVAPGRYGLRLDPPPGAIAVSGSWLGAAVVDVKPGSGPEPVELAFSREAPAITGRITDTAGQPLRGARVTATVVVEGEVSRPLYPSTAETGADGRYVLEGLKSADWRRTGFYLRGGPVPEWGSYTLQVDAAGYARTAMLVPSITEREASFARALYAEADRQGLDDGGIVRQYPEVRLPDTDGTSIIVDWVLEPEAQVLGHVVDTTGEPITGDHARIQLSRTERPQVRPLEPYPVDPEAAPVDGEGRFMVTQMPAGTYQIHVHRPAGSQQAQNPPVTMAAGEVRGNVAVVVEAEATRSRIVARVMDATRGARPVPGLKARVERVETDQMGSPVHGELHIDEATGVVRIDGVSPGLVMLEVGAPGYAPTEFAITAAPGAAVEIDLRLPLEGHIEGYLTVNGAPARGQVHVAHAHGEGVLLDVGRHDVYAGAEADDTGYYHVGGLGPGEYLVSAMVVTGEAQTSFFRNLSAPAQVAPGAVTRVDFPVVGTATLRGVYTFPAHYRRGRVHLVAGDASAALAADGSLEPAHPYRAMTERMWQSGPYEFRYLEPGTYTLIGFSYNNRLLEGTGQETDRPRTWRVVTIGPGDTLDVPLELTVP